MPKICYNFYICQYRKCILLRDSVVGVVVAYQHVTLRIAGTRLRQTNSSRILLGFWWISGFILYFSYTSTLISFLTVPRMENLIDSLEELSQQKAILWTYRANTAYENLFGVPQENVSLHSKFFFVFKILSYNVNLSFLNGGFWERRRKPKLNLFFCIK